MSSKTVFFIHGLFLSYNSWDHWVEYFQSKGYTATAIPYPQRDKSVEELRAEHPNPAVAQVTFTDVVEHCVQAVNNADEPPIIIGHSLGGLIVQLLLNRGLGAAGVALDSAPPQGVLSLEWSFVKSNWPLLNPLNSASEPFMLPFEGFQYAFVNGMPLEEQRRAYDEQVVPESLRIARGPLGSAAKVDFAKPHAPLLMTAGELDHITPASLNRTNYNRYQAAGGDSVVELKEFAGRNHYLAGAPDWQEIADYILAWLDKHQV